MTRAELLRQLRGFMACEEAIDWIKSTEHETLQAAWDACERPDWMLWFLHRLDTDRKLMVLLACDCAATALPIWRKKHPKDDRPAKAIRMARAWVRGKATIEQVQEARRGCYAAAAAAAYAAAAAACDAACDAAAAAVYAAACDARLKANRRMANLIRKRVPDPEEVTK